MCVHRTVHNPTMHKDFLKDPMAITEQVAKMSQLPANKVKHSVLSTICDSTHRQHVTLNSFQYGSDKL